MKKIINNQNGHGLGEAFSFKNLAKIVGVILTAPISIPILMIKEKRKKCKRCIQWNEKLKKCRGSGAFKSGDDTCFLFKNK